MNTFTEKLGIIQEVVGYMQNPDNQAALTAKNFDVTPHITRLNGELGTITTLSPQQKKLEVDHKNKTAELKTATTSSYTDASGVIDAMMGVLGKNTVEAKKLQTIRSKVRRHDTANPPEPTPTVKS